MKKIYFLFLCLVVLTATANAQSTKFSVTGVLKDTLSEPLSGATVILLYAEDSIFYKFGVSGDDGSFTIKKVKEGDYIFQATFLGYKTFSKPVSISGQELNIGTISLQAAVEDLGVVEVKADAVPLEIRNDTIAYNADAFKTQPGAVAEDLLKRLPGVEVDKDGTIKAQGEEVQRVLVDGKEFFGKDPQTATKNLPADAIDKVEVFDQESDMAEFTGVDDGQRSKTINLTLKKDRKKGFFGNIEAGYGTEDRFQTRGNINRFTEKVQTSFIGMVNNTNRQGFSFREYANFMGGFSNVMRGGRGRINTNDLGLPINSGLSDGFITTGAGGLNLNYEYKKKSNFNISYFYTDITKDLERQIDREYIFDDQLGNTFYNQADTQQSNFRNHRVQSNLRHQFNDDNSLIWRADVSYNAANYDNHSTNENLTSENVLSNEARSLYDSESQKVNFNTNLTFRHKFAKAGRSIAVTGAVTNQNTNQDANLSSWLNYYQPDSSATIMQLQEQNNQNLNYRTSVTYTEPLGKRRYLSLSYNHRNYSQPLEKTFTNLLTGEVIDTLNVDYKTDYQYHQVGANLRIIKGKSNLSFGVDGQMSELDGEITNLNYVVDQPTFYFVLPKLSWRYELGQAHNLRFTYNTSANEPDINELQPVLDNSDPLNLYIGDPELSPEFTHRLRLQYVNFDQFTFSSFFANLVGTYTANDITQIRAVDRNQVQITQPTNVDYRATLRGFASYSTPVRALKSRIRVNTNATMTRSISAIANITDVSEFLSGIPADRTIQIPQTRYNTSGGLQIENRGKDIVDIQVGANWTYNITAFENTSQSSQTYFTQRYSADLLVNITDNWSVSTEFDYTIYNGDAVGTQQSIPIWQASVRRYFLKNRRAELRFTAMDLLNRNVGINWTSNLNYIEEEVINSLGRYFMLTFKYQIRKFGK